MCSRGPAVHARPDRRQLDDTRLREPRLAARRLADSSRRPSGSRLLRYEGAAEIQAALEGLGFEQRLVLLLFSGSEEVHDAVPAGPEELGDQASVAAPPEGFRAHEARGRFRDRGSERRLPSLRAHAGGIATERGDADAAEGVLARLADEATTEFNCMSVGDPALLERSSKSGLVGLRVVTRTREPPHIDERGDPGVAKSGREFVDGPSPVADRPDIHHIRMPRFPIRCTWVGLEDARLLLGSRRGRQRVWQTNGHWASTFLWHTPLFCAHGLLGLIAGRVCPEVAGLTSYERTFSAARRNAVSRVFSDVSPLGSGAVIYQHLGPEAQEPS